MAGTNVFIKQGTNLSQTTGEELDKLSQKAGTNPLTPQGAAAIGANQDQAKMAGSKARKDAVLAPGTEPSTTLQQAQRTQPAAPTGTQAEQQLNEPAAAKLERMNALGSLNMQVENLVSQKLQAAQAQQAQLQLNQTAIGAAPAQQQAALTAALQAYKAASTEAQKEAAILSASNALGRLVTPAEMQSYFQGAADEIAGIFQPAAVTVASLGLQNTPALAQDLGVSEAELLAFTPEQLKQAIQNLESREFNRVQTLQAELLNATGNRREQIQQELRSLGASGTAAIEAQYDQLQASIDNADTVNFNGQDLSVEELLGSDAISDTLIAAISNPAAMKQLEKNEPALAAWAKQHQTALAALAQDVATQTAAVGATQDAATKARGSVSAALFEKIFGPQATFSSAEQLAALKSSQANSALWQAIQGDADLKARLEKQPALVDRLKALNSDAIGAITSATKAMEADGNLAALVGYTPGGIATEAQAAKAAEWAPTMEALSPTIAGDRDFQAAVNAGDITAQDAQRLISSPKLWEIVKADKAAQEAVMAAGSDPDKLLDIYFGTDINLDEFNRGLQKLEAYANMGDEDARQKYIWIRQNLAGENGRIGPEDVALMQQLSKKSNMSGIINGQGSFSDVLAATKQRLPAGATFESSDAQKRIVAPYVLGDGLIDDNEAAELLSKYGPAEFSSMLASPWMARVMQNPDRWRIEMSNREENSNYASYLDNDFNRFLGSSLAGLPFLPDVQLDRSTNTVKYRVASNAIAGNESAYQRAQDQISAQINALQTKAAAYKGPAKGQADALIKSLRALADELSRAKSRLNTPQPKQGEGQTIDSIIKNKGL